MSEDIVLKVIEIFSRRTSNSEIISKIREAGRILSEADFFHYVMGLAWNHRVPLTPRDVGDIKRALGLL